MSLFNSFSWPHARGICYSGFRDGQRPGDTYPTAEEIREDLLLLNKHWRYLRLYDVDQHAQTVLEVIRQENLDLKVMLGAYIEAEMNNFGCPWKGGVHPEDVLIANKKRNEEKIHHLSEWANKYQNEIFCLSVGNEACVDWTDHFVPEYRILEFARTIKSKANQPVSYCENYVPWLNRLKPLAAELDFISIHTYPVWEFKHIHEAIDYTIANYQLVQEANPNTPIAITEAGWATVTNGLGILSEHVSEENQRIYFEELMEWSDKNEILTFFFEAFDENWKGSEDPEEPEKHWGVYHANREPKELAITLNQQ